MPDPVGDFDGFCDRKIREFGMLRLLFFGFVCLFGFVSEGWAVEKPNVIFMMADDMGMGDTSAYQDFTGNADAVQLATPNMERLARMGVRFTDAHTPSSRCSLTRYGLLTGRYPWRNRLKYWVLFGTQGDPMIERDRPTLATMFQDAGYGTAIVGKWHVGLRFRRSDGSPAAGWEDADLTQPLFDSPVDHGFEFARYTSRSHGTSGPSLRGKGKKPNGPAQSAGPGHLHGAEIVGATGRGKELIADGEDAYVFNELGGRHSDMAIEYLSTHLDGGENAAKPFFLYYPSPSNHSPYTPDTHIGDKPSRGASRTKSGEAMDLRHDFIYENDLILGRFIDWLEENDDPRNPGKKLIETTLVVFTSDNGAEKNSKVATGPFRSNKGSTYEGGHRVPYLVAWGAGGIGDGDAATDGVTSGELVCHTDVFATLAELIGSELPNPLEGERGAEDSFSVLKAWRGGVLDERPPVFAHDHKEDKNDPAVAAIRLDSPTVDGEVVKGQWKLFFDADLLRSGKTVPVELYDLSSDSPEENNRISEPGLEPLVKHLSGVALDHRNAGGHRLAAAAMGDPVLFDFRGDGKIASSHRKGGVEVTLSPSSGELSANPRGVGVSGGAFAQVEGGESISITFDGDVVVQSAAVVTGNGVCGGFYQVGDKAPLAIYCVDGDIDDKDQSGVLSDIGVVKKGESFVLSSAPHYGSETPGQWRLQSLSVRALP
ncbi:MAG: sulfatase-like hydrolase/transferase [Verrucomicrobiales bacterium]|nr:sulfatase-like hydrolase/transferase [Verrucomicrobiales bacterium]